ncbi:hypothetical protein SAMN00120144_4381, partial [Hymenobacter roseosalivarius DSM 11622]
ISGGTYTLVGVGVTAGVTLTSNTGVFTNLAAGTYSLSVALNGLVSAAVAVTINAAPVMISLRSTVTAVTCFGTATGQVQFTAVGGTAPYTFTFDGRTSNGSGLFTNLAAGTYAVLVRDANGCSATASTVTITQPALALSVTFSKTVNACGGTAGQASVSAAGGTAPYTYQLRLAATGAILATSPEVRGEFTFNGLAANTYRLWVVDAQGCAVECPTLLSITTACLQQRTGSLEVYPNPFTQRATAEFQVVEGEQYSLVLYDNVGRLVRRISEGVGQAGRTFQLDVVREGLPIGVYQLRLTTGSGTKIVRVVTQ